MNSPGLPTTRNFKIGNLRNEIGTLLVIHVSTLTHGSLHSSLQDLEVFGVGRSALTALNFNQADLRD